MRDATLLRHGDRRNMRVPEGITAAPSKVLTGSLAMT